ncbi:hypothetical protein D3C76_1275160 [compost metagenome]
MADACRLCGFSPAEARLLTHLRQPIGIHVQHLVAPGLAWLGIAGMHPLRRHQHQGAGYQALLPWVGPGEHAAARIHRTYRKGRMAMGLVAGPALPGAPAFDEGQGCIAPQGGLRGNAGTGHGGFLGVAGSLAAGNDPYSFFLWL